MYAVQDPVLCCDRTSAFAPPSCRTSQYHMTFILLSVFLWNDLGDPGTMVWDWRVS